MSEIGNKELLRLVDSLLRIEDQQGTPAALETGAVLPVIDIGRFISPTPSPTIKQIFQPFKDSTLGAGVMVLSHEIAAMPGSSPALEMAVGKIYKLLAMQSEVVFPAGLVDLTRIAAEYFLTYSFWEGTPIAVKFAGGDIGSTPLLVDSDQLYYRFSLGSPMSGSDGTTAAAPAGSSPLTWSGFLWPADITVPDQGIAIGLRATYRYGNAVGASIAWPTGTQIITRAIIQQGDPSQGPFFL